MSAGSSLLSVAAAVARVWETVRPLPEVEVPAGAAVGLTLAEDLAWPSHLPSLDVSAMDGVALHSAAGGEEAVLEVAGTTCAGEPPGPPLSPGQCRRIMTGAPLPPGADAVQRVERTAPAGEGRVRLLAAVRPWENVRRVGSERRAGARALERGARLGPVHAGLLALLGRASVRVIRRPRVTVAATGDELVGAGEGAAPWQVPNSNGPLLAALVRSWGAEVLEAGILPDRGPELREAITGASRRSDLILLSGGVSRGDLDLVTGALPAAGLNPIFHGVAVKPGKPILFASSRDGRVHAFGLPGNPLSALVGCVLFAWPALERLAGRPHPPAALQARLAEPLARGSGEREELRPARLSVLPGGGWQVAVLHAASSADLGAVARAGALVHLPPRCSPLPAGAAVAIIPLPGASQEPLPLPTD